MGSATTSSSLQYTDDMFSTFLYDGQFSNLEVNNNVDLSNDGGLVWFKNRDYTRIHSLFDSVFSDSHTRLKLPNGSTQFLWVMMMELYLMIAMVLLQVLEMVT